ncbi:erythromycin esterase family protein [Streptomyces sp. NPDC005953]|uniref:erythromycin esterase family protein n=1 Tax=Streptomyces sp. NPDC005953 TaxID=3156719 RepID=UPI0033F99576
MDTASHGSLRPAAPRDRAERGQLSAGAVRRRLCLARADVPHGPAPVPPPDYAEAVLGSAGHDAYLLDLRSGVPPAGVWRWLTAPARTRLVGPGYDPADDRAHQLSGGSLAQWFDAIVHWRKVTPARPLRVPHSEPTP